MPADPKLDGPIINAIHAISVLKSAFDKRYICEFRTCTAGNEFGQR